MRRALAIAAAVLCVLAPGAARGAEPARVTVGSKKFTESVILAELMTQLARSAGADAEHRRDLGGTRILFEALKRGDLDAYPEYTGTLRGELLAELDLASDAELAGALEGLGLRMSAPIGPNNTYAIGANPDVAERLGLERISDLARRAGLRAAFSNEFMDRADGWPGLRDAYGLAGVRARGMDHDLTYRALASGDIDVTDLYATDAEIAYYGVAVLEDDLAYFPRYDAVVLYRADLADRAPDALDAILRLEGSITDERMVRMNQAAKLGREGADGEVRQVPGAVVASEFLAESFGLATEARVETLGQRLLRTTLEQFTLVGVSMLAAILVAVPLGVLAARVAWLSGPVLGLVGVLQTIPALALLVLLIGPFGLTATTAIVALFLYSLLPIARNTHAGVSGVAHDLIESADAIGLTARQRLWSVELPLAAPSILAGVKTAAVINVGAATLAALIGAGGYGQPILTGIRLDRFDLILEGAAPAALMALGVQGAFDALERAIVPRSMRRRARSA